MDVTRIENVDLQGQHQAVCATSTAATAHHHDSSLLAPPSVWNSGILSSPAIGSAVVTHQFLPDFTEHPKPKRRPRKQRTTAEDHEKESSATPPPSPPAPDDEDGEIAFYHDFVAGGVAGCASVIVGHPFDT